MNAKQFAERLVNYDRALLDGNWSEIRDGLDLSVYMLDRLPKHRRTRRKIYCGGRRAKGAEAAGLDLDRSKQRVKEGFISILQEAEPELTKLLQESPPELLPSDLTKLLARARTRTCGTSPDGEAKRGVKVRLTS